MSQPRPDYSGRDLFSPARLGPLAGLEGEGIDDAVSLNVWNAWVASRLWLPIWIAEVAYRNITDQIASETHPNGPGWLFARPGSLSEGAPGLAVATPSGVWDDPVASAHAQAVQQGTSEPTRDDVIARLTLGFWVVRTQTAFRNGSPSVDLTRLVGLRLGTRSDDGPGEFRQAVIRLHRLRNRVAHHEPLVLRSKYLLTRNAAPKKGLDLLGAVHDAIWKFGRKIDDIQMTAVFLAPMARPQINAEMDAIRASLNKLIDRVDARTLILQRERDERRTAGR